MTNILKRMLSLGDVRVGNVCEANTYTNLEGEGTIVDVQELEANETEPVPNFAEAGITNHSEIVKELTLGSAAATFHVGKEGTRIIMQKRMVMYHSPVIAYLLPKTRSDTLALPNIDPDAFYHIYVWMSQDKLGVLADCTRSNISTGIQDACTVLCRMFAAASHLEIAGIQPLLLEQLEAAFAMARNEGRRTPVAPSTVMEVWEYDGEEYVLWKLLLEELCVAFSNKPRPVYAEYEQCLEAIPPLRLAVANALADRILFGRGFKVETVWGPDGCC